MTDPALCPLCERLLDDGRPIQTSLDGDAHAECVTAAQPTDEGDDA